MLTDGHCHFEGQAELAHWQKEQQMYALINCQSPAEWAFNAGLVADSPRQVLSFGVHPWDSATWQLEEAEPYLRKTAVIGEIGLDSVWTEVPLATQRRAFHAQLDLAQQLQKPVVLHTKGCEEEILGALTARPNRYLIHWYSDARYQKEFIALGCYFTIGVELATNPAVEQLARQVPLNRLLLETDGLSAIEWAQNRPVTLADYPQVLTTSLKLISQWRDVTPEVLAAQIAKNFRAFIGLDR